MNKEYIYLDYAANTPVQKEVLDTFNDVTQQYFANPNSTHNLGKETNSKIVQTTENILKLLKDEVPHGIYVEVEKMKQRKNKKGEDIYDIEATIYCLRNSHKGIIIGKNGEMLKRIGRAARIDMEENFGLKVNLKTWVKVKEDWQENESIVKKFKLQ